MPDERKTYEDEASQAYAIWRGNSRGPSMPDHWDDLAEDIQEAFRTVYIHGRIDAQNHC